MSNIPVTKPRSRANIIRLVKTLKSIIGFNELNFPVCEFIENILPQLDSDFTYEYVDSSDLPDRTYAYYDPINNVMKIDQNVYLGACNGNPRDRFTIAHEIGHYFTIDEIQFARGETKDIPAYINPEWQANAFASELLMPSEKIYNMSVDSIVKKCNVSATAASIALKNAKKPNY